MSYSFPIMDASQLVEVLTSWDLDCTDNDFRQPTRERWQPLFTAMLGFSLGTFEPSDMANRLLQTQFEGISSLEYPAVHEEANPVFNLCRGMQRVLYPCGVDDFNLQDIIEPKPQRLLKICSALNNFISFRSERMEVYERIREKHDNIKKQREVLTEENEMLQKKINAIKASRAQQEPHVQQIRGKVTELQKEIEEKNNCITQQQKETTDIKAKQAEKKAQLSRVKERLAAAKEEGVKLSSQIVQSPERMKGERERMEKQLRQLQGSKEDKLVKLVDLQSKCNNIKQQHEDIDQAIALITKIEEKVHKEKELSTQIHKLQDELAEGGQELQECNTQEQHLKMMIDMKEGKLQKLTLQHQNKLGDMQDMLDRLTRERDELLSERSEDEEQLRGLREIQQMLAQQDAQHAQKHTARMELLSRKYQQLQQSVDEYHRMFGNRWLDAQKHVKEQLQSKH